jgi:hypothetical protein
MIGWLKKLWKREPEPDFPCRVALLGNGKMCNRPAVLVVDMGRELESLGNSRYLTACDRHQPFVRDDWFDYLKSQGYNILSRDEALVLKTMQE